jgi:preprotein translocase subunit SecE
MARNTGATGRASAEVARRAFSLRFVGETLSELRRVTWPTRQETVRLTIMVMWVAGAIGLFLGIVDFGFGELMDRVLQP